MKTYSFYDLETGLLHRDSYEGPEAFVNVPAGHAKIEGRFDRHCQRVDVTGAEPVVIDYVPPAPADDEWQTWVWDTDARRWHATPTLARLKADRLADLQASINALEADQPRAQRDVLTALLAGTQPPEAAVQRLEDIEVSIVPLRALRAAIEAAATVEELDAL